MSHQSVAEAGTSTTRQRVRLTKHGAAFLTNYARTVNSYPQKAEKEAILASLRAIPGNEAFTLQKIGSWFARHRNPSGDPHTPLMLDEESILFPKLTPNQLQQLRLLYKKRAEPSEGIITFWAERIRADRAEVVAWIQYQREKAKEGDASATPEPPEAPLQRSVGDSDSASVSPTMPEFPRPHLPTPAKSPSLSPHTRVPSLPPIAVKVEEHRQCLSPVSSLNTPSTLFIPKPTSYMEPNEPRSVLEGLPPLSRLHLHTAKSSPISPSVPSAPFRGGRDVNKTLADSIADSLRLHADPSEQPPPRTADEFLQRFDGVKNMIETFMHKYDSGQLVPLGWDSGLSP